ASGNEVELALGPLRDHHGQALGGQRQQGGQARRRATVSRLRLPGPAPPRARPLGHDLPRPARCREEGRPGPPARRGAVTRRRDLPVPTFRHRIQGDPTVIRCLLASTCLAALLSCGAAAHAHSKKIDLRTRAGTDAVHGQWRYHDVKIVEVTGKNKDGSPNKTYSYEPKAKGPDFDDSGWEIIAPETLKNARSTAQCRFCRYRITVTFPAAAARK